jgi:hypothetical protein
VAKQWEILTGLDRDTGTGVVQLIFAGEYVRLLPDDASALGFELMRAAGYAKAVGGVAAPTADAETGAAPAS